VPPRRRLTTLLGAGALLLAAAGARGAAVVPSAAEHEFDFVVLGDSQFHDPLAFNRIIDEVRLLRPAFVVQVGDMIEGYSDSLETVGAEWRRFQRQIDPLAPVSFIAVPGNHDLYGASRKATAELLELYESRWGPSYRSFAYGNARFFVLNSDAPGAEGRIDGAQRRWLEAELAAADEAHRFVFMHRPPVLLENADSLHALFRDHGVSHVFYGHLHHYHYELREGVRYVMTNAAANSSLAVDAVGGFHHYLKLSVRDAELDLAVLRAGAVQAPELIHPDDNYDLFRLQRGLAPRDVELSRQDDQRFLMEVPLTNPTERTVTVYATCSSEDNRWNFDPAAIDPLPLAPGSNRMLALSVSYEADRVPESLPGCSLRFPFQKRSGEWLEHSVRVQGAR
jgi:predicted phosphodiesterase